MFSILCCARRRRQNRLQHHAPPSRPTDHAVALEPVPSPRIAKPILPSIDDTLLHSSDGTSNAPSPTKPSPCQHQNAGELLPAIDFTSFNVPLPVQEAPTTQDSALNTRGLIAHKPALQLADLASSPRDNESSRVISIWTTLPDNHPACVATQTRAIEPTLVSQVSAPEDQPGTSTSSSSQTADVTDDPVAEALIRSLNFASSLLRQAAARTSKTELDTRIQDLPQELSDRILECYLASTMPPTNATISIDHTREPAKVPAALHINRSFRSKHAELYYGHGQFDIAEEIGWTPALFAARIMKWVSMVAPEHRRLIATVRVGIPDVQSAPEFRGIHTCMITLALRQHPLLRRLAMHEKLCVYNNESETRMEDLGIPRAPAED